MPQLPRKHISEEHLWNFCTLAISLILSLIIQFSVANSTDFPILRLTKLCLCVQKAYLWDKIFSPMTPYLQEVQYRASFFLFLLLGKKIVWLSMIGTTGNLFSEALGCTWGGTGHSHSIPKIAVEWSNLALQCNAFTIAIPFGIPVTN